MDPSCLPLALPLRWPQHCSLGSITSSGTAASKTLSPSLCDSVLLGWDPGVWFALCLHLCLLQESTSSQNLAAIIALVSDGIQSGHMKLHAAKVAYSVGARGSEIRSLAEKLWDESTLDPAVAKKMLEEMKAK